MAPNSTSNPRSRNFQRIDNKCSLPLQYIKQQYVLDNKDKLTYKIHRKDVYDDYARFMKKNDKVAVMSSTNFYKALSEFGIVNTKSNGKLPYTFEYDVLLGMFKKHNIISEDELSMLEGDDDVDSDDDSCGRDSVVFRIEKYKQRIAELEKMLQKKK